MKIIFYPAIDIKNGKLIRLTKGELNQMKIYGDDPITQATKFEAEGAKWIHVVDIDGAFQGDSKNLNTIFELKKKVRCNVQVGGGIRNLKKIETLIDNDIDRVILGTVALKDPELVKNACKIFPKKIAVGLDARNEFVATEGWAIDSSVRLYDIAKKYEDSGVDTNIFTDIEKDGSMEGVNLDQLKKLLKATNLKIIVSGGVSSLDDLNEIKKINSPNLVGVISGKAIYEKKFTVSEAINLVEG